MNFSVRVGDTVHRRPAARAKFVHRLLDLLERAGWDGAPRFLGIDEKRREVLSFVDGHVAWEAAQPSAVGSDESLARVAELVREFHDMTVRPHQHAAGARIDPAGQEPPGGVQDEPADHALGPSRGGWTSKVHLACEQAASRCRCW
ncbi:hypothetical protein [Actinomadura violacea]|uniref:hypothetical protein n=1 Tax=Actinomadura violacea TaxID=2819934 RepID=UPI003555CDFC